jgi:hypothetical protein
MWTNQCQFSNAKRRESLAGKLSQCNGEMLSETANGEAPPSE